MAFGQTCQALGSFGIGVLDSNTYAFNLTSKTWVNYSTLNLNNVKTAPTARALATFTTVGKYLVLIGGYNFLPPKKVDLSVEKDDLSVEVWIIKCQASITLTMLTWTEIKSSPSVRGQPIPFYLVGHSAIFSNRTGMIISGGQSYFSNVSGGVEEHNVACSNVTWMVLHCLSCRHSFSPLILAFTPQPFLVALLSLSFDTPS